MFERLGFCLSRPPRAIVHALGLQNVGGWAVVRDELSSVVNEMEDPCALDLREVLGAERLPISCYLHTKLDPPTCGVCFSAIVTPNPSD